MAFNPFASDDVLLHDENKDFELNDIVGRVFEISASII